MPRATSVWRPSGATSSSRALIWGNVPVVAMSAITVGEPMRVKPGPAAGGSRQFAVPGSSPPGVVVHGLFIEPAIGSSERATDGSPPAEVNDFDAGSE